MNSGVYYIRNSYTNRMYIGQSYNIDIRFEKHWYDLRSNRHHNKALQRDWNDFGSTAFTCGVLTPEHDSRQRHRIEQLFIQVYQSHDPRLGYNLYANHWAINH